MSTLVQTSDARALAEVDLADVGERARPAGHRRVVRPPAGGGGRRGRVEAQGGRGRLVRPPRAGRAAGAGRARAERRARRPPGGPSAARRPGRRLPGRRSRLEDPPAAEGTAAELAADLVAAIGWRPRRGRPVGRGPGRGGRTAGAAPAAGRRRGGLAGRRRPRQHPAVAAARWARPGACPAPCCVGRPGRWPPTPRWQLRWFEHPDEPGVTRSLQDALLAVPHLGVPGSDFIQPIMDQAESSGVAAGLLGTVPGLGAPTAHRTWSPSAASCRGRRRGRWCRSRPTTPATAGPTA